MKYKDPITGDYKELHFKTGDTLPVGTIVEYDGYEIPPGYKEVLGVVASVVISPTEPETGEEVWIQKGKNLFKKTNVINGIGPTSEGGFSVQSQCTTSYVKVIPGETYVISSNVDRSWVYNISKNIPKVGEEATSWMIASGKSVVVNIPEGYSYLNIRSHSESNGEDNLGQDIQVEQGATATDYEAYIQKKIHTKNDNDVYEEFYKEREIVIVDISLETGSGSANFPQGFNKENCIIIGHIDRNKWNIPFGNVKEVDAIINGDNSNVQATSSGNFSGGASKTSVVLMKLY